jgi:hypothetical protein
MDWIALPHAFIDHLLELEEVAFDLLVIDTVMQSPVPLTRQEILSR